MADYIPIFEPGRSPTWTVGATAVTGGQLVMFSAAKTVIPTTGSTAAWEGVAQHDAPIGGKVSVVSGGVQELTAGAAVAVAANVIPAAAGKVVTIGAEAIYPRVVGVAVTAAAADGDKIWVRMAR